MAADPCDTPVVRSLVVAFALLVAGGRLAAAETIKEITVEDAEKTTNDTVILIANIEVGDDWSPQVEEQVKTNLNSSGLFKSVEVFWENVAGGVRVRILVKDKHSWVIAPTFYNQPTNTGGGVGFGENNLFGLNQKLLLYAQIATGDSFFIGAWVIPSIGGSRFYAQFDTLLKSSRNIEYAPPGDYVSNPEKVRESRIHYLNGGVKLGVELFHGVKLDGRLRGAKVSYPSAKYVGSRTPEQDLGISAGDPIPAPGKEGADISTEWTFSIDNRANYYGVTKGKKYQLSYERALPELGSDFHYYYTGLSLYQGWQVLDRHNLVLKTSAGYGHHLPFQQEYRTGGTTMRGYKNDQFRGDFKASANAEYSFPLIGLFGLSMRGLMFWDAAYTTFLTDSNPERNYLPGSRRDQQDMLAPLKNSVGVGTRFYLRQIVLPLLGVDFGYGLEARDFQLYLAIGLTD